MKVVASYSEENKVWSTPSRKELFNSRLSVGETILYMATISSATPAEINSDDGSVKMYNEIYVESVRVAQNMQRLGIKKGDVIFVMCNSMESVTSFLIGSLVMTTPLHFVDYNISSDELKIRLKDLRPKIILCDGVKSDMIKGMFSEDEAQPMILVVTKDPPVFASALYELYKITGRELYYCHPLINGTKETILIVYENGKKQYHHITHYSILKQLTKLYCLHNEVILDLNNSYNEYNFRSIIYCGLNGATRVNMTEPITYENLKKVIHNYEPTRIDVTSVEHIEWIHRMENDSNFTFPIPLIVAIPHHLVNNEILQNEYNKSPKVQYKVFYSIPQLLEPIGIAILSPDLLYEFQSNMQISIGNPELKSTERDNRSEIYVRLNIPAQHEDDADNEWIPTGDIGHINQFGYLQLLSH